MKKYGYDIVSASSISQLTRQLNRWADAGWRCVGYTANSEGGYSAIMESVTESKDAS